MRPADPRSDEARSQQALDDLRVLDSAPEPEFDALARAASLICQVPIALITLIDSERQWFKAQVGLPELTQTPRDLAFCAHAVLGDGLLEVPDASQDLRFADNPLVTGHPDIRFYAGAPLRLRSGHRVGTLCLIDHQPRQLSDAQREALQCLAVAAASALEGRRANLARQQAMADLAASEARFRALSDGSPLGVYQTDAAGGCVYTNHPWQALHGLSQAESLGSGWADAVHPQDRAAVLAACRHSAQARLDFDLAFRVQRPDGSIRFVHARARPMLDQHQALLGHIGSVEDVTLRHHAERALQAEQQRLRNIIEGTHAGIWEWNVQTGELRLNERSADMLGQTQAGLGRQTIALRAQSTHPDDWPVVVQQMQRHLSGQTDYYEVESRVRHRDGHWVWVLDRGRLMTRSADGKPEWVFGIHQDISRRKQLEQQLIDGERSLRLVMEASPQGMLTIDLAGQCRYANAAWRQIAGLTPAQSVGLDLRSIIHPDDIDIVLAQRRAVQDQGGVQTAEHRYRRADGSVVWVRARIALLERHGSPDCWVGAIEDVTERRRLDQALAAKRAELARSNQDLERFAYVASHDLQEPLRMVTSYGQLLMRRHQAELSAEAQEFLHYMVDGGQRAQALIRDLLSLARIDNAAQPHQAVALDEALAAALQQLRLQVQETGASITHDPLPTVLADPLQIGQLLGNLLGNALKFRSRAPPTVHISAEREAGAWRISVRDNGIGIDPKFSERVFVMFQRLHLRSEHEGTGIGLAICKRVVENHGGQIGLQSVPGQGSTFHFTLPDAGRALPGAAPADTPLPGG